MHRDSKNIFSLYYGKVLLEQSEGPARSEEVTEPDPSGLTGKDRAYLSRLENLKELVQMKKDISEEERNKALAQIDGAIAKLKGTTPQQTDTTQGTAQTQSPTNTTSPFDQHTASQVGVYTPQTNTTQTSQGIISSRPVYGATTSNTSPATTSSSEETDDGATTTSRRIISSRPVIQ